MIREILYSLLNMLGQMAPYILLGFLIAGILHAFVTPAMMSRHLSKPGIKSVVKAALFGIPLPLCSCGVLPAAIALRRGGASKAASTSFLIATPQTGIDSIAATGALLGPAFAVIRPFAALLTAVLGGTAVAKNENKNQDRGFCAEAVPTESGNFSSKCMSALKYGFMDLVGSIGKWLVIGLVIAAVITVFVPVDVFATLGEYPLLAMICVLVVAIPMYVCATGSIPIAMSLMIKGLSPGTALVLLMAGPAANFASAALISREIGKKTAAIYIGSIVAGSIIFGLIIDYLLPREWFAIKAASLSCHITLSMLEIISSVVLIALLAITFFRNKFTHKLKFNDMVKQYQVSGMNCPHCQAAVAKAISSVDGVTQVDVNLSSGVATVEGIHDSEPIICAVRSAGFDIEAI